MFKTFSHAKFLSLPLKTQHKKLGELLGDVLVRGRALDHYMECREWAQLTPLHSHTFETLSDTYHEHFRLADLSMKEHRLLPKVSRGDYQEERGDALSVSVYLDKLRSAHNVGSILRTVEALQLGDVVFSPSMCQLDHAQVQKTAMGSAAFISAHQSPVEDLTGPVIALETVEGSASIYDFTFPEAFTLIVGNEEYGCSEAALKRADVCVHIPLYGRKNSLNVANAFAIAAAQISHQRRSLSHV